MSRPNLSRRLFLEESVRTSDGAGGATTAWTTKGALWAEVMPQPPREALAVGGPTQRLPLRILLRGAPVGAPSRPRPGQRLREGTRFYLIDSVAEVDALGRVLLCLAHEEAVP